MDRDQLREMWARNKDRPQFVREHREAFVEHLSDTTAGHLPAPGAPPFEYRQFIGDYKAQVTRQLAAENGETPNTDAAETEA